MLAPNSSEPIAPRRTYRSAPLYQADRAVLLDLLAAAEPLQASILARRHRMLRATLVQTMTKLRAALAAVGGKIEGSGLGETLTYRLIVGDRAGAYALAGGEPEPPQPVEPIAAPAIEPPAAPRRSNRPDGVTLAPCGYEAWSYRPAGTSDGSPRGGAHVIRISGEAHNRVLTATDRENGLTTAKASLEILPPGDEP